MSSRRKPDRKKVKPALVKELSFSPRTTLIEELSALLSFVVAAVVVLAALAGAFSLDLGWGGDAFAHHVFSYLGVSSAALGVVLVVRGVELWRGHGVKEAHGWRTFLFRLSGAVLFIPSAALIGGVVGGSLGGGEIGTLIGRLLVTQVGGVPAVLLGSAGVLLGSSLFFLRSVREVTTVIARALVAAVRFVLIRVPTAVFRTVLSIRPARHEDEETAVIPVSSRRRVAPLPRDNEDEEEEEEETNEVAPPAPRNVAVDDDVREVIVSRRSSNAKPSAKEFRDAYLRSLREHDSDAFKGYEPPKLSLLVAGEGAVGAEDDEELRDKSRQIESKLLDFGISGRVTQVHPGPVITLFEFEPAAGVKVGRISALQDDLAMSLKASSIRIIAPLPKRGTVGIEVPNRNREIVRLRDVLESEAFVRAESILSVPVGKDTYGDPVVVDIATMPHLLLAGATGTGKSVSINAILASLLYRASPADLGLILIDPKVLELSVYDGIPHLRVPVVTVPKQARAVLQWAVDEMERRYRYMQQFGVRNIDSYNRLVRGEEVSEGEAPANVIQLAEQQIVAEGTVEALSATPGDTPREELRPLPKIVIVIDELADLMLTVGRDLEELITRLAQKARAAGIHLIVATQRPSVDVITGLIKANFPARISFRVSSRVDSRTILDSMGSERLLGRGDMLFLQPGADALRRIHGAFVSDAEVKRVVSALRAKCGPKYDERILAMCERALKEEGSGGEGGVGDALVDGEYDEMYDKAVQLVMEKGQASTSMVQRAFRIGYNRAARIIEMMERDGIVGPMDGVKPREVLLAPDPSTPEGQGTP